METLMKISFNSTIAVKPEFLIPAIPSKKIYDKNNTN